MTRERFDRIIDIVGIIRMNANYLLIGDIHKMVASGEAIVQTSTWENHKKGKNWSDIPPVFSTYGNDMVTYDGCTDVWIMKDHCEVWVYEGNNRNGYREGIRCKFHITGDLFKINGIGGTVEAKMFLKASALYYEEIEKKQKLEIIELKERLINK